jgi:hypothetical protein
MPTHTTTTSALTHFSFAGHATAIDGERQSHDSQLSTSGHWQEEWREGEQPTHSEPWMKHKIGVGESNLGMGCLVGNSN